MFKKLFAVIIFVTLTHCISGTAFATFADSQLIRVYYNRTTGIENATDLGTISSVLASAASLGGTTIAGSFGTSDFAAYFALDRTNAHLWVANVNVNTATFAPAVIGGSTGLTAIKSGTDVMYAQYGGATATSYTGTPGANGYKGKLAGTQGFYGNTVTAANSARTYGELNLTTLATNNTQSLWYFATPLSTVAAEKIGMAVAQIVTNTDGSTTITVAPPPVTTIPGAPTIGTATATGDGIASISFSPPTSDGGRPVSGYSVIDVSTSKVVSTGPSSPILVNGLINGTPYTFTVTATNSVGTSVPSAASNSVTTTGAGSLTPQTITFTPPSTATYGDAPVTLVATASSNLPVSFQVSGPATLNGSALTITDAGVITVTASQAGDTNFAAAADVPQTITVAPKPLTITANNASRAFGAANPVNPGFTAPALVSGDFISSVIYTYAATADATAAVSTTHSITPSTAIFSSGTAANYTITYTPGILTIAGQTSQTITFTPPATATYGDTPITLAATASSNLPVSFTLVSGPATLSNNTLTITGVGPIIVKASQAGNTNYSAAPDVQQTIMVATKPLTIAAQNATRAYGVANPTTPGFTTAPALVGSDSISAVSYTYAVTADATAAVGTTHNITPSTAVFSSGSAANYSITYAPGTLTIAGQASQSITFTPSSTATYGDAPVTLSATASSTLPVNFTLVSGPATLSGNTLTITGAGAIVVKATQTGNSNYSAATDVQKSITVAAKSLTVTAANTSRAFAAANPTIPGFTAPGLVGSDAISSVTYSYAATADATAAVGTIHNITPTAAIFSSGSAANYIITYAPGTLTIAGLASQTITFGPSLTATYGDAPITLVATASSNLPVTFALFSGPATLSGNVLTITGAGSIVVKATQAGTSNYSAATDVQKNITVAAKALTITTNNASRAYGAANPASPGFTAPALVGSDAISSVTYSYAATADATAAVGTTHSITPGAAIFSSGTAANYTITYIPGTLTIVGLASQTITFAPSLTATYGDAAVTLVATASSGLPVSFTLVSGPATLNGNTLTITGAGSIIIKASQAGTSNYSAAPDVQKTITVAAKTLTITANNASRAYGAANPATPGFTAPALVGSDSISAVTYTYAATAVATATAGSIHSITPSGAVFSSGSAANYTITYTPGTLTIAGSASQTISFTPALTATYGDAAVTLAATASSNLPVNFTLVSGPATLSGTTMTITGAGDIIVKASQAGDANFAGATDVQKSITVAAKALTITALNANRSYGAANPATPGFSAPSLVGNDAISTVTYSYAATADATAAVGTTHSIMPGAAVFSSGTAANYAITYIPGTLTIAGLASQTITFTPSLAATYGDAPVTLVATASSNLPVSFTLVSGPATQSGNTLTITGAGSIIVKASQAGTSNYSAAPDVQKTILVAAKAVTVTASDVSRAFGSANPAIPGFTAPALVGSDSISTVTYSYAATADATAAVGTTHSITPGAAVFSSGTAANYIITYAPGTLTIAGSASQTITFTPSLTATYGDAPVTLSATASSGLPVSLTLVSGPATLNGNTLTITGVGNIVVMASQTGTSNYSAAPDVQKTITVAAKVLTITATNATRAFAAANPATPGFTASSLVGGDAISSVTYTYAATADATAAVGTTHSITPSTALFNSGTAVNYIITYAPGTLTIAGGASQTITFAPSLTATYGDAAMTLVATATSNLPVSFTLVSGPASLSSNVLTITGAGAIVVKATQAGTSNYTAATDVLKTITIVAKAVTVTASDVSRAFGSANPATPGFTAPALVGSDAISAVTYSYAATADATAAVGSLHSITPSAAVFGSGSAANYVITYAPGTLTIAGSASQTITFTPSLNATYGAAPVTLVASASSGLPVNFTLISGPATLSGNTLTITAAGSIVVKATQAGSSNYSAAPDVQKTITVAAVVPGAPTAVSATTANAQATVSFTAPIATGGSTITGYKVTSTPGGLIGTGPAGPITVTGLTNGTAYTFTVTALNAAGAGPSSPASNVVTTEFPPITFTVFPMFTAHGSMTPSTNQTVVASAPASFVVTPDSGYQIASVSGTCGGRLNGSTYTTSGIIRDCTVEASFVAIPALKGDLNGDKKVDVADALLAMQIAAGLKAPTPANMASGDVAPFVGGKSAPDGKIDIADVVAILQKWTGQLIW
jgi:hypothetical protein